MPAFTVTPQQVAQYLSEGKRLKYVWKDGRGGGFVVRDDSYYPGEPHWIADVQEGWAQGVYEPICGAGDPYLFTNFLKDADVFLDYGHWLKATIAA